MLSPSMQRTGEIVVLGVALGFTVFVSRDVVPQPAQFFTHFDGACNFRNILSGLKARLQLLPTQFAAEVEAWPETLNDGKCAVKL